MLNLFRKNEFLQLVIILVAGVALWMPSFLHPAAAMPQVGNAPLYELLASWLSPHPQLATWVAFVLVVLEGWLLNVLLYNHKVLSQSTLFPMFAYVLLMSHGGEPLTLTPMILVNLALLGCLSQLMVPDTLTISFDQIFQASALVALATLCYLPAITLMVPLIIIFLVHSLYHWRHWVMLLLGFLAPYILLALCYFMADRLGYISYLYRGALADFSLRGWRIDTEVWGLVAQGGTLALIVVSLLALLSGAKEHTTMYRENVTTLSVTILAAVGMMAYEQCLPLDLQLLALPASVMVALFLLSLSPRRPLGKALGDATLLLFLVFQF